MCAGDAGSAIAHRRNPSSRLLTALHCSRGLCGVWPRREGLHPVHRLPLPEAAGDQVGVVCGGGQRAAGEAKVCGGAQTGLLTAAPVLCLKRCRLRCRLRLLMPCLHPTRPGVRLCLLEPPPAMPCRAVQQGGACGHGDSEALAQPAAGQARRAGLGVGVVAGPSGCCRVQRSAHSLALPPTWGGRADELL